MEVSGYKVTIPNGRHFAKDGIRDHDDYWDVSPLSSFSPFSPFRRSYRSSFRSSLSPTTDRSYVGPTRDKSYVEVEYGRHYRINLKNSHPTRCQAKVKIDGKPVGSWVIPAYSEITIERPVDVDKKFTFYRITSESGIRAGLRKGDPDNGLVQVEFTPERRSASWYGDDLADRDFGLYGGRRGGVDLGSDDDFRNSRTIMNQGAQRGQRGQQVAQSCNLASCKSLGMESQFMQGGTGLCGKSHQRFRRAGPMDLDYSKKVTVNVRLVGRRDDRPDYDDITPLGSYPRSNPVPPPIRNSVFL